MSDRLTPIDILNTRFRRTMRGYNTAHVDDFLRRAAEEIEAILIDRTKLQERIGGLERELRQYRELESTMRDALVLAQKAADETRAAARVRAEASLQEAQSRAAEIESAARTRIAEWTVQIETLRQERLRLTRDLRAQLTAQIAWLDDMDRSAAPILESSPEPVLDTAQPLPHLSLVTADDDNSPASEEEG